MSSPQSPRDRSKDERRKVRMGVPVHRRFENDLGPGLEKFQENSVPFSISPGGAHVSGVRQTLRDYSDMYTPEEKQQIVESSKQQLGIYKSERKRPLKDI